MRKLVSLVLVLCTLLTILPLNALAASKTYVIVTKDNAPIRSGAGEKYEVLARATKNTVIETTGTKLNLSLNAWYKLNVNGKTAYIYSGNVKKTSVKPSEFNGGAIKLNASSKTLNLSGSTSASLKAIVKYKSRTESNVSWSSSNSAIASVNANGVITAKKVGTATITAKHKIYGTTATCKVTVANSKQLGTTAREQSNSSSCSGAAARTILTYLGLSSKTDLQHRSAMGSATVGNITKVLNANKAGYKHGTYSSLSSYQNAIIASIKKGKPVVALVKITDSKIFKYTSKRHFTVVSGYHLDQNGNVTFTITDSYKIKSNGGKFTISASKLFAYSKAHTNRYWLIVGK